MFYLFFKKLENFFTLVFIKIIIVFGSWLDPCQKKSSQSQHDFPLLNECIWNIFWNSDKVMLSLYCLKANILIKRMENLRVCKKASCIFVGNFDLQWFMKIYCTTLLHLHSRKSAIIKHPLYDLCGLDLSYGNQSNPYRKRAPHEKLANNILFRRIYQLLEEEFIDMSNKQDY